MAATYNKFDVFSQNLVKGVHDFTASTGHTFNIMLTNTIPVRTNTVYANVSAGDLATAGGYTAGGTASAMSIGNSTGTETVTATAVTFTCTSATIGPFQYAILYDITSTTPLKPLVCWWDYGSSITLNPGETFTVEPNSSATTGTLFTLA